MKPSALLTKPGTVLVVIDVQEKFEKAIPRFDDIIDNIARLVTAFQMYNLPIIVTEQYPAGLGQTVGPIRGLFKFLEVVEKIEFSATDNPRFWAQANPFNPNAFVLCGIETHVCINQTATKLAEKGLQAHVVADATGSRRALDHNVALRKMELAGARITTTEMCLFELTEKAGTESFKFIQRIVKGKPTFAAPAFSGQAPAQSAENIDRQTRQKPADGEETRKVEPSPSAEEEGNVGKKTPETIKAENKLQSVVDRIIEGGDVGEKGPSATTPETAKAANILQSIVDKIVEGMPEIPVKDLTTDIDDIDKLIGTIDSIDNNKETGTSDSPTTSEGEK